MPRGGEYFWDHYHRYIYQFYRNSSVFTLVGRDLCICLIIYWIIFLLVVVIVILSTSLTTVDEYDYEDDDDTQYAPLETRLIDVSQTFCDDIELENPSHQMPATAYVLSKGPSLTDEHDYNISESNLTIGGNSYQYWNYYLNHGSSMNASICIKSGDAVEFYIIQGSKSFEHWQDGGGHFVNYMSIGSPCPKTAALGLDFVDKTDDYFFAYASVDGTVTFETNMSFHRKEFGIVEQDVEHRCDAGGEYSEKCTVSVPYNDEYYFLLATGNTTSSDGDEDGASVSWSCKPRVWVYILAFFVPSLFSLVLNTVIIICCLQHRCKCCCTKLDDNDDMIIMCCTQQCRCDCCCANIDDDDNDGETSSLTTSTTSFTTTTTTTDALPSELPNDPPPPYNSATAPQAGYYGRLSHSPVTAYPPMLQPTTHTPTIQNYGATDNKSFN